MDLMQRERNEAAAAANAEDASVWRWLSALLEERRIKWRYGFDMWIVTVDRRQMARAPSFDSAIRLAKIRAEEQVGKKAAPSAAVRELTKKGRLHLAPAQRERGVTAAP
jgi:hypothetical protein